MTDKDLGNLVRKERLRRGLGLNQVARIVGIPGSSLSRFECGKRGLTQDNKERLLAYFHIEAVVPRETEYQVNAPEKKFFVPEQEKEVRVITCKRCLSRTTITI